MQNLKSFRFKGVGGQHSVVAGCNFVDRDGNPAGGYAADGPIMHGDNNMPGLLIRWQEGPVDREGGVLPNGTFVEDVLTVCKKRLEFYQEGKFACDENAEALSYLNKAIMMLLERRADRQGRGVEGKHEK